MQLYFIRHGQSANNAIWDKNHASDGRSADPELTSVGYQQAELVGKWLQRSVDAKQIIGRDPQNLAGVGITHIYCSLMVRAVETGTVIAGTLGLPLHAWADLHEVGGIYLDDETTSSRVGQPGYNRSYLQQRFPNLHLSDSIGEGGWWNRPFEAVEDRMPRARRFINDLFARHGDSADCVAVVSHGDFYNLILAVLLQLPAPEHVWFSLNNAGVSRFDFNGSKLAITYMNRIDFLPRELVT